MRLLTAVAVVMAIWALWGPVAAYATPPEATAGERERTARSPAVPSKARVRAVRGYLATRGAVVSWALIDSRGRVRGFHARRVFVSASVVKAMLLVAYLRQIGRRPPDASERALLHPMITASDNERADDVYYRVGDGALYALARRAGMRQFSVAGYWANAQISALDQARLFRVLPRLVPRQSRPYARRLLSSVVPWQTWGFSRFSRPNGFASFFKGGWRGTDSGRLVHEAALFEHGRTRFSMALLSDGNPTHEYGTATLRGVARRIFAPRRKRARPAARSFERRLRRAGLVDVVDFAPGIAVDLVYRTPGNLTGRRLPGYCTNRAFLLKDATRSGRGDLVGTYIARRSAHNTGGAVDITLVRRGDGGRVRMGAAYDDLGPGAHTLAASGRALRNRLMLAGALERFGWAGYWREWWHFEHPSANATYLDIPLGCGS